MESISKNSCLELDSERCYFMWLSPKRTLLQCIDFFMSDIASPSDFANGEGQLFDRDAMGKRRCATRPVHLLGNLFEKQVAHSD